MKLRSNNIAKSKRARIKVEIMQNEQRNNDQKNDLDITDELKNRYQIKNCFVKLNFMHTEKSAMDETSPAPASESIKRRPGRKPKTSPAAKVGTLAESTNDKTKSEGKVNDSIDEENNEKVEDSDLPLSKKAEKTPASDKRQTKKEASEPVIDSGGRGKRTRKPNPRYMDDESLVSATKHLGREDSAAESENAEGEDGDDEMQSSDEPRNEGPLKKRMLQKHGIKSVSARKPVTTKTTQLNAGRKSVGSVAAKRKLEPDIDIDDEHGKQLFLDAKRRLTQSPSNSDEDSILRRSKNTVSDILAAKLRSKFPGDFTVKRAVATDNKTITVNRNRLYDRNKSAFQKDEDIIGIRKRNITEETETSEDDSMINKNASDHDATSPKVNNRRKTQHTKILSDDRIVRTAPATQIIRRGTSGTVIKQISKSPLTQNQLAHSRIQSSAPTKTYSISAQSRIIGSNKPAILRPPPRILNSTLCKPTNKSTVPSLVTKLITKDDYEQDINGKRSNSLMARSKENVTSYTYTEKDGKMIPKKTVVQMSQGQQQIRLLQQRKAALPVVRTQPKQQKIISEPVSLNLPNSRRIRKIICFETWYVIKMVDEQPRAEKSVLNMSLMQIGNEIEKIKLPSEEWTYKILLQPLSKQLLAMRKTKVDDTEPSNELSPKTEVDVKNDDEAKQETNEIKSKNENDTEGDSNTKNTSDDADKCGDEKTSNEESEMGSEESTDKSNDESSQSDKEEKTENESNNEKKSIEAEETGNSSNNNTENTSEQKHDVYTGEVHDPNIKVEERHNYRPINIMFRRKCQNPNIRIQFDRTVILKNQTFYLNIDGKNVRLVASPQSIDSYDDIRTLLQIVNDIDLNSCCVELATHAA